MECPTCGALMKSSIGQCNDCAATVNQQNDSPTASFDGSAPAQEQQASKLIEFPGVSRSTVPQWRKEVSERVRAAQEKKAREEVTEFNLETSQIGTTETSPQLELLPHAEAAPVNPLVAAALRRIERAHEVGAYVGAASNLATAVAYAAPMNFESETHQQATSEFDQPLVSQHEAEELKQPEKTHNLVVVPTQRAEIIEAAKNSQPAPQPKPRRMIGDLDDPALNYLDSVPTAVCLETAGHARASIVARLASAVIDLFVVSLLCAPVAAALELSNTNWQDPRIWIFSAALFSVVGFLYLTISTALTGRTIGLRLLSLRIVDARTGLIPTGTQSAGRALIYLASLLVLGITSIIALLNSDRLTAHDRITRTAVIQI